MSAVIALLVGMSGDLAQSPSLDALAAKYGLEIVIAKAGFEDRLNGYTVTGKAASDPDIAKYARLLTEEWSLYPIPFVRAAKTRRIVICRDLALDGQVRAAVPAFATDTMYFDVALGSYNEHFQRVVIHHEYFHVIDERLGNMRLDPDWNALNPPGFKYGSGGEKMRTSGVGELTDRIPAYLTPYGTSAVEEDKAELFAHLIVDPSFVSQRASKDAFLRAKVELLKKRLGAFVASLDGAWWEAIAKRRTSRPTGS